MTTPAHPKSDVGPPNVGELAPDFTLPDQHGVDVTLSSVRGDKFAAVVFYPYAFSGICTGELRAIRDGLEDFQDGDVQVFQHRGGPGIDVSANTIGGNLQCQSNRPAPTGGGNVVDGSKEGQCRAL